MSKLLCTSLLFLISLPLFAAQYQLDPTHSFVQWRVQHLGYSWLYGRFNTISGSLKWDQSHPENGAIQIEIVTGSIDSNHAERDKHLRGKKFLDVENYPEATFVSTEYRGDANGGILTGTFTLHGVSKTLEFEVSRLGQGNDPWMGYRVGFVAKATIDRRDYGITENLGPMSNLIELELGIEGILEPRRPKQH